MLTVIAKRIVRSWRRLFGLRLQYRDSASTASRAHASDTPAVQAELAKQAWIAQLQERAPHLVQQWNLAPSNEPKAPRFPPSDLFPTAPTHPQGEYQGHGVRVDLSADYSPISGDEDNQINSNSSFNQSSILTAEQSKNDCALPDAKSESMQSDIADTVKGRHAFINQRGERLRSIFSQGHGDKQTNEPNSIAHRPGHSTQREASAPDPLRQINKSASLSYKASLQQDKNDSSAPPSPQPHYRPTQGASRVLFSPNSESHRAAHTERLTPPPAFNFRREEHPRSTQALKSERNTDQSLRPLSPKPQSGGVFLDAFHSHADAPNSLAEPADRWPALLPDRELETNSASGWMEAKHSQQLAREQRGL